MKPYEDRKQITLSSHAFKGFMGQEIKKKITWSLPDIKKGKDVLTYTYLLLLLMLMLMHLIIFIILKCGKKII